MITSQYGYLCVLEEPVVVVVLCQSRENFGLGWVYWTTSLVTKKTNFWMTVFITSFSVALHDAMPGHFYGNPGLPKRQDPPSWSFWCYPEESRAIRLASDWLQELPERLLSFNETTFWGFTPVFSFGVDSLSLFYPLGDHKAVVLLGL